METQKRVGEIRWGEATAVINRVVNEQLTAIEKDDTLEPETKKLKVNEIERAWQRILVG
jgi:ribosomal protein S3AE